MDEDWERRFQPRYKPDVALYNPPDSHATLIEKYNLNGSEPIDFDAMSLETQELYQAIRLHSQYKTIAFRFLPFDRTSQYYPPLEALSRQAVRNENQVHAKLASKRLAWLKTVDGTRRAASKLIREKLLDFMPVEYRLGKQTECVACLEPVNVGESAFVCDKDHVMHFECVCDYALAALLGHRKPSLALCCPFRCGSYIAFKSDQEPDPELKTFRRVVCVSSRKRKRSVSKTATTNRKRSTPLSNKNARTRRNNRRPKTRSQSSRSQKDSRIATLRRRSEPTDN